MSESRVGRRLRQAVDGARSCTPQTCCKAVGRWMWQNLLLVLLIVFMVGGTVCGIIMKNQGVVLTQRQLVYFGFPGEVLMRLLKMLIIPLVVSSLMAGLANLDLKTSGRIGMRAVGYYFCTTFMAVVLGIFLCQVFRPGEYVKGASLPATTTVARVSSTDALMDLIRNLFPDNLIEACFRLTRTVRTKTILSNVTTWNETNGTAIELDYEITTTKADGMNIMGLVAFSVAFGMVMSARKRDCKALINLVEGIEIVTMRLIMLIMWYSPVGVFFMIASKIVEMESASTLFEFLAYYSVTVVAGLFIHGLVILPILFGVITRRNPIKYIMGIMPAIVTAAGTASSSATLPITFRCLEEVNKIDKRITRFVLPIGATINMDGTALYEAVAPMFIAQARGIPLGFVQIIAVSITATFASIGAAAIPQAGLVTMVLVLTAVGLDPDDVSLIIAVDWALDRIRTFINVISDSIGAGTVHHFSKAELAVIPVENPDYLDAKHEYGNISGNVAKEDPLLGETDMSGEGGSPMRPIQKV